jgi:TolB-like protein/DNA-binding winged helix-turn-helix (wHTH) protein
MEQEVHSTPLLRFGVFELDLRTGELRKSGKLIRLAPQPFRLLALLASRPGQLVTREEIQREIWGDDTVVDYEQGLSFAVKKARSALGDNSHSPRYIETLPRRGYRFIAPIYAGDQSESVPIASEPAGKGPVVPTSPRWRRIWLIGAGLAVVAVLFVFKVSALHNLFFAPTLPRIHSIAVLPLQNLSGDKEQGYFADGMTDELITNLGQMSALRVISRTSVMRYKRTTETVPQIGRELSVDAILEGTVFRSGNRVRITAQLIDARSDRHLWAHAYERDLRDVITLQDEVARDIADAITVKLTPRERARLTGTHPVNPEAHEAYMKGLYYWNQFTAEGVKKSLPFFQEAVAKDPKYALGYSGLANYYGVSYVRMDTLSHDEACPKMEDFSRKAIELDDSISESHASLGGTRWLCDWDWDGAEREFKRALQLNPNSAQTHRFYSIFLVASGHPEQGVVEAERAVENDPMSGDINMGLGWVYYLSRHYDKAIQQEMKTIAMDPKRPNTHFVLGCVYEQKGQYDLAIREYRKSAQLAGRDPETSPWLGSAYALARNRQEALKILHRLGRNSTTRPDEALGRAIIFAGLGEKKQAFASLEKAFQARYWSLIEMNADPRFDSLRSDPRFQVLLRRMNFPK